MAEPWVRHISTAAGSNAQWLTSAILTHYETGIHCPPEIIVPFPIDEQDVVEELLQEQTGRRIRIHCPERGAKRKLITLAEENAHLKFNQASEAHDTRRRALAELAEHLRLPFAPVPYGVL